MLCCCFATLLAGRDLTFRDAAIATPVDPTGGDPVQEPTDVQYYPSDEPVRLGLEHFNRAHYGIAQRYFKDAVEKAPRDGTAWIGLAASYDRLRRFDLADQAYTQAIRLGGETVQILNDEGYSLMLRGNLTGPDGSSKRPTRVIRVTPLSPTISSCSMAAADLSNGRPIISRNILL